MLPTMDDARDILHRHFGYSDFRPAQSPVVRSILAGVDTLAVLPTGAGKSVCFQVPAMVLGGLTIVVSPLISLMQDQVAAANARGLAAACLNSTLSQAERDLVWQSLRAGTLRLLYVSPERLRLLAPELRDARILPRLLAIDEAHCIAEWGHDFRPSYRTLTGARYRLGRPPTVALTGSATPAVRKDIATTLGFRAGRFSQHVGSFDRPNLWFGVVSVASEAARLAALRQLIAGDDRMAIVYAPTRSVTEALARRLTEAGHRAAPYHAGLSKGRRAATLEAFLDDRVDLIVATCAFGMGIDKPSVRLVVHWTVPPTPEAYYQEAGRAGRDGEFARCVLLWRKGDATLHRRQLEVTFPPVRLLERLWSGRDDGFRVPRNVRASAERLRNELRPERGPVDWRLVQERRKRAESRIEAMEAYARRSGCRRQGLIGYFGETLERCSGCDRCAPPVRRHSLPPEVTRRLSGLRRALAGRRGPWGGCLVEPDVLLRLASHPPASAAALADVPGVGPALAQRYGATILSALGVVLVSGDREQQGPAWTALSQWRDRVARTLGTPAYAVVTDTTLRALASADPFAPDPLNRIPGLGPRARKNYGDELLQLLRVSSPPSPPAS
jgi:ATP-dependent DNA helicase RecQ